VWRASDGALALLALASLASWWGLPPAALAPTPARPPLPVRPRPLVLRAEHASSPPPPADLPACQARLAATLAEQAALARKIERNRGVFEVFDQSEPSPALSTAYAALLGQAAPQEGPRAEVQCRGRICCVRPADDVDIEKLLTPWFDALAQQDRMRGGPSWRGPRQACFRTHTTDDPPEASDLVGAAISTFRRAGVIQRCQQNFRDEGHLDARINIVADEGDLEDAPVGITIRPGGQLAGTPLGQCLVTELRRVLDAVALPADYESAVLFVRLPEK
jgi:hypothetical protein